MPSHIKQEMHHVAVLHHVFLAFGAEQSLFAGSGKGTEFDQAVVIYHFGADKAALDVGVNLSRRLRCFLPATPSPA